jgi:hypothetical protein
MEEKSDYAQKRKENLRTGKSIKQLGYREYITGHSFKTIFPSPTGSTVKTSVKHFTAIEMDMMGYGICFLK